ncbi:MarR family winged helix-turn-helix transcriptional regulator [Pseudarthrobacter sp. L1SW]|uniref:MarR family winged helix-turn-helix transcriptional regulator n=1 Tax=Pseudarthrobacter sp. L1SW TaxID=2851598 RepID=UPI001E4664CE|nr:MarR family transcriptional regulator [Pseudarthrobacter sp. L1SW]UEL28327.1 MarR family transcriptional regulator [Pseudarthrobacter sp. L1SW]
MAGNADPGPQGPPSGPPAGPHPLVLLLQEFTLEANRYVDTAGGQKDMHRTDLNALAVIMRHTAKGNVVTPGLLRKELHLSSPATTALIDRLDHSGHVIRERHGSDRRQVQLKMTPKAFQDGGTIFAPLARQMGTAMAAFTPEELETASRFMTAMVEATVAAREESSGGHPDTPAPPTQHPRPHPTR